MLNLKGTQTLTTPRLLLRRFTMEDAPQMFANYASDARVTRFLTWEPYESVKGVEGFLEQIVSGYDNPAQYHWAIVKDGEVIGSISTVAINLRNENCEIGYCLGYAHWGQGVMSEALNAVMKFLFQEVGMHRIIADHDSNNPASGKVMKKCGMKKEGCWREHMKNKEGGYSDMVQYGILAKEYEER